MKRKIISSILVLIILMLLSILSTSCTKKVKNKTSTDNSENDDTKNSTDKIQLWYYDFLDAGVYTDAITQIVFRVKRYCNENKIPIEFIRFSEEELSHEDYIFKRNLAAINGNMIAIDDSRFLHGIATQHADYSKIDSYANVLNAYKDRFCIPLAVGYQGFLIENKILEHYGINTSNNVLTYVAYLNLKQRMKENGARFELNRAEYIESIKYHLDRNDLLCINDDSEFIGNKSKFKEMIKKTSLDLINDILQYNDGTLDMEILSKESSFHNFRMHDLTSKLDLWRINKSRYGIMSYFRLELDLDDKDSNTLVVYDDEIFYSPCLYIHQKVTNDSIYDLANHLVNEDIIKVITIDISGTPFYTPVFATDSTRRYLNADENWKFQGKTKEKAKEIMNDVYEIISRDDEELSQMADSYLSNNDFKRLIIEFIENLVIDIGRELSETQQGNNSSILSLKNYNPNDKEIKDLIDKKIDEFLNNFYMHNF